jgi:hypothetical protein
VKEQNIKFDFERVKESVWLREGEYVFSYNVDKLNFKNGLPNGIFNKKYPGMGATYCEFYADRPSILVFPFRRLAKEKAETYENKGRNTFFVGTDFNNKSTSKFQIKEWYSRNKDKNPKFSVVADSIQKLVEALQEVGSDPFKEFFLVLDEVELLQMQSGFRSKLPLCFDYFKKFENKCLVSATLLDFSDETLKKLPTYDLEVYTHKIDEYGNNFIRDKESLEIRNFKINPHWGIANQLVEYFKKGNQSNHKFFIGLNSLEGISEMIEIFEKANISNKVSVHVSSDSKDSFLKKYNKKDVKEGILPTEINLTSCVNFSGIDLNENIHSIAISLKRQVHHAFSFENLVQFFGRSRVKKDKLPFTFALSLNESISYKGAKVTIEKRKNDLNGLIDYVANEIEEEKDRGQMEKAISESKSGLIYKNPEGSPAVNWLLQDLEKYELEKVNDYKEKGKKLLEKLGDRYEVKASDHSKYRCSIIPSKKTEEEKEGQSLEAFLDNLDEDYDSRRLISRFLEDKSNQSIKVAAYWYLFGRTFLLPKDECKYLATYFSKLNKPYQITGIVVAGLRFYTRHAQSFEAFVNKLYEKRNNRKNLTPSVIEDTIKIINGYSKHFYSIFDSGNSAEGASILMEYFFGLEKFGGNSSKFTVKDDSLNKPQLVRNYPNLEHQLFEVSQIQKGSGVSFGDFKRENLIDTEF